MKNLNFDYLLIFSDLFENKIIIKKERLISDSFFCFFRIAKRKENLSIDEINKKLVKIMKEYFIENSNKLNYSNDALRLNNSVISFWNDYRSNSGLRKSLMCMNSFHFMLNL